MVLGKTFSHLDLLNDELENEKIVSDPNSTFKLNSFNNTLELILLMFLKELINIDIQKFFMIVTMNLMKILE